MFRLDVRGERGCTRGDVFTVGAWAEIDLVPVRDGCSVSVGLDSVDNALVEECLDDCGDMSFWCWGIVCFF